MVCDGRGISIHIISAVIPLHFVDDCENSSEIGQSMYDVDRGLPRSRPVIAIVFASCLSGALRLHTLEGISSFFEESIEGAVT